jgi:predicted phage-related endonuclease
MPINFQNLHNFKIEDNRVILHPTYLKNERWRFKKITGTRFAAIIGLNKYTSPFKVWMSMVNLFKDVIDPTLAKTGNVIEPKVRDYVSQKLNIQFKIHEPKLIN